jgi:hypothetical protein
MTSPRLVALTTMVRARASCCSDSSFLFWMMRSICERNTCEYPSTNELSAAVTPIAYTTQYDLILSFRSIINLTPTHSFHFKPHIVTASYAKRKMVLRTVGQSYAYSSSNHVILIAKIISKDEIKLSARLPR